MKMLILAFLVALGLAAVPAAHAQQSLYVANGNDNTIEKFNSAGVGTKFNVSGDVNGPNALAFDSAGNLFVSNNNDNTIEKFDSQGVGTKFNVSGDLNGAHGLAFDSAGNLFVANYDGSTITKFNSAGVGTKFNVSGDVNGPNALAFDSAGNLFVSNAGDNTIEKFNSQGVGTQFNVSGDVNTPIGLAVDSAGNLFVANGNGNTIEEFNSAGVGTQFNKSGDLSFPYGLAFDNAGTLFAANLTDNTIEKFDSQGVGTKFNVTGNLNRPFGLAFGPSAPAAVAVTVLHSFNYPTEGYPLQGLIQGPDGSLYGETIGHETVFQIAPDGTFRILHRFSTSNDQDGFLPSAKLLLVGNQLFGTCLGGGIGNGIVFVIDLSKVSSTDNAAGFGVIRYFNFGLDGSDPSGTLFLASDGNLYGTTAYGGRSFYSGTIFQIKPDSGGQFSITPRTTPSGKDTYNGSYATIYKFGDDIGLEPRAGVVQGPDGFLYGTTQRGGGPSDKGTVYKVGTDGSRFTLLHAFLGPEGATPRNVPLFGSDGSLYGTALYGGQAGAGTVFQIQPGAGGVFSANAPFQVIHDFTDYLAGNQPTDALIQASDGNLYGATNGGGAFSGADGTIFSVTASGGQFSAASLFSSIYSFSASADNNTGPYSVVGPLLQGQDGRLYGETVAGGLSGGGTVFVLGAGLPAPPAVSGIAGSIAPPDATTADTTLIVHGSNFNGGDKVAIDGKNVPVTSRDYSKADEQITVTLPAPLKAGAHTVVVADTAPGIRVSSPVAFLVTLLSPRIIQITSGSGGAVTTADTTLIIHGDSFMPTDIIGGLSGVTFTQSLNSSGSQFTLTLSHPLTLSHYAVTVTHAGPNGLVSNIYDLPVGADTPVGGVELTVNSSVPAGGVILKLGGTGFSGTANLMQINPDPNSLPKPSAPATPHFARKAAPAAASTGNSPIIDHVRIATVLDDTTGKPVATFLLIEGSNFDPTLADHGKVTFDGKAISNAYISSLGPNSLQCTLLVPVADNATHYVSVFNPSLKSSQEVACGVLLGSFTADGQFVVHSPTSYQVSIRESILVGSGTSIGVTGQSPIGSDFQKAAVGESPVLAGVKLLGQDGASVAVQGGGNAVARPVAPVISNDGGSLITNDGGSILAKISAGLIGQDGANLLPQDGAGLITNDGASVISNDGGSLVNGGNVLAGALSRGSSSFRTFALPTASPAATTSKGFMDVTLFVSKAGQGMRLLVTRYTPGERDLILYKDPSVTVTPSAGTPPPVAAAPAGLTVTRGPVTRDPHTHQPFQVLTLTNTGTATLAGPFLLGLTGLPAGVTVAGSSSVIASSPAVSMPGDILAPGASVRVRVDFTDPTNVRFSYGTAIYAGL